MLNKEQVLNLVAEWLDDDPFGETLTLDANLLGQPGEVIVAISSTKNIGVASIYPAGLNEKRFQRD